MVEYTRIKKFAENSPNLYEAMKIYGEHCLAERGVAGKQFASKSKDEMETAINKEYINELYRRTNMTPDANFDGSLRRFANNSQVLEMADDIRDYMIDMLLPETLMTGSLRYFADFRFADLGDSMSFDIENNALYNVSKAGYRKRSTNLQKLYGTTVTLAPINRQVTVGTDLFEILTGRVSIAKEVMKAVRSIETAMMFDAYDAFATATGSLTGNLAVTNYSEKSLISLCQTVTAYNQGRKAVIIGTPVALKSVLPTNANYRYLLDDEYVRLGHLQTFNGYDVLPLDQVANPYDSAHPYALKLDDTKIWVVSPAADKIVKIGVGGEMMSHTDAIYDNANLLQLSTLNKAWDTQVVTNSVCGVVTNLEG